MSARLFFIIRPHVGPRGRPWRRTSFCKGAGALLLLLLPLFVVLFSPGFCFAQTDGVPPSFKQIYTFPARGPNGDRHVIVSELQSGWLRSLVFNSHPQDDEDEEEDN